MGAARASLARHVPEEDLAARAGRARRARTLLLPFPPGRRKCSRATRKWMRTVSVVSAFPWAAA